MAMSKRQHSSCNNCRALANGSYEKYCVLGYTVTLGETVWGVTRKYMPSEPCERPITVQEHKEALAATKKRRLKRAQKRRADGCRKNEEGRAASP